DRGEHAVFPGHGYDAAVPAQRVQLGGDPPAVFVELGAQGVEGFADVEGVEPAALFEEVEERVRRGRVGHGDEVGEEGHLDGRALDHHARMPPEFGALVDEDGVDVGQ